MISPEHAVILDISRSGPYNIAPHIVLFVLFPLWPSFLVWNLKVNIATSVTCARVDDLS
uniref:Uncharacterized protein n=1 Tax=Arundo donax TaxID=35708 RepID=A0A0A8YL18_ARUDO